MFTGFDFEVIWRSLPYLFLDGMAFTRAAHRDGRGGRHRARHADRDDAALAVRAAVGCGGRIRQPGAVAAARARHLLVLLPHPLGLAVGDGRRQAGPGRGLPVGAHHVHDVRGRLLRRDHARRHPVGTQGPGCRRLRAGHDLLAGHGHRRPAAGLPQHAAGAADPDHHPVPGHLARLRAVDHRLPRRREQDRQSRLSAGGDVSVRRCRVFRDLLRACRAWCGGCRRASPLSVERAHDRDRQRQQVVQQTSRSCAAAPPGSPRARWSWCAARRDRASPPSSSA